MARLALIAALAAFCVSAVVADGTCGCLHVKKLYDLNGNGIQDAGEVLIQDWRFKVRNVNTNAFFFYNTTQTLLLPYGTYEVCDQAPTTNNWGLTAGTMCKTYVLDGLTCVDAVTPCVCTGQGNSQLSANWWNPALTTPADLAALAALPIVDGSLAHFTPTDAATSLKNWYKGATTASPPAYYLSVNLALAKLNLLHGFTSASTLVKAPRVATILGAPSNYVTLGDLVALAVARLTASTSDPDLSNIATDLHNVNTNEGFVQASPCPFAFQPANTVGATDLNGQCCQQGCLKVAKTYDLNANGQTDVGEPDINGWKFKVTSFQTGNTAYYQTPSTLYLPFGTYEVCDVLPQQYNWWLTGRPLCQNYTLSTTECVVSTATCLCTGASTAQAGGYWTKQPGLATIDAGDLAALSASNLVKADLSPFTGFTAAQFVTWHNAAASTNAPYWLSDVLALSILNVRHGINPDILIKAPTIAPLFGITEHFFVKLSAIHTRAKQMLLTPTIDQATMLIIAQVLKDTNANQNFAQDGPCVATFPTVVSGNLNGLQPPCGGSNPSLLVASGDNADLAGTNGAFANVNSAYLGGAIGVAVVAVVAAVAAFFIVRKVRAGRTLKTSRSDAAVAMPEMDDVAVAN
eukprot:TRINITY_DN23_c0_g1_i2.p1 TRINITY_DN23_c0_g1~~TRINITY_DN23_c0_g1_i2.p1  ORF type:complete len:633 (+),score=264.51 TRINITY_DN23_c0_g1_i2:154-2052(+)